MREGRAAMRRAMSVLGWALALVVVGTTLGGCAVGPSEGDVARVRDALDAAGVSSGPVYVANPLASGGTTRQLSVIMDAPNTEFGSDDLLEVLRIIYENTPDGFAPRIDLHVHAPSSESSGEWGGPFISLGPLLAELGLHTSDAKSPNYRFDRSDLDDLFE